MSPCYFSGQAWRTLICYPLYRDIYDLAVSVCKEWNIPLPDHEEILRMIFKLMLARWHSQPITERPQSFSLSSQLSWKLPIMTIAMNAKVHRYDATLALIKVISDQMEFVTALFVPSPPCPNSSITVTVPGKSERSQELDIRCKILSNKIFQYFMNKRHFTCDHKTTLLRKMEVIMHERFPTRIFLDQFRVRNRPVLCPSQRPL